MLCGKSGKAGHKKSILCGFWSPFIPITVNDHRLKGGIFNLKNHYALSNFQPSNDRLCKKLLVLEFLPISISNQSVRSRNYMKSISNCSRIVLWYEIRFFVLVKLSR